MLRQLPGDTEATGLGKFSNQSPRYRDITSRELASADHPRFGRLRPSAIHSTPTLTQLRKQRKRKSVAVVLARGLRQRCAVRLNLPNRFDDVIHVSAVGQEKVMGHRDRRRADLPFAF